MSTHSHAPQPAAQSGNDTYERRDLPTRPVAVTLLISTVVIVLTFIGIWGLATLLVNLRDSASAPASPLAASAGRKEPPAPRLQFAPVKDIQDLHNREESTLNSYGWVDKPSGTVRIPIDKAIDLLMQRGLPSRPPGAAQ